MFWGLLHLADEGSVSSLQVPKDLCPGVREVWMEQREPSWFPTGTSDLESKYSCPQTQQATAAKAPFLVPAPPCTEQA